MAQITKFTPEVEILSEFGRRLARIRKAKGYSQIKLAHEAGIGVATLRRIEGGHDSQLETWFKLLKALDMAPAIDGLLPETFDSPMAEALAQKTRKKTQSSHKVVWGDET